MKSKSICFIFLSLFIIQLSLIESTTVEDINPIDSKLSGGVIYKNYDFDTAGDAYFSYELPTSTTQSEDKMTFTIHNTASKIKSISCIFSTSTDINAELFSTETNICTSYSNSKIQVQNIIFSLSKFTTDSKLYIKINGPSGCKISIFFREQDSYKTELSTMKISNAFAHIAFEFDKEEYYNKDDDYLLSSSEANSILIYGEQDGEIKNIDETPVLAISKQSLASIFWYYEKIYIFIGKSSFDSLEESNEINIKFVKNEENTKFYYYKPDTNNGFSSFYYYCTDDKASHLLFINHGIKDFSNTYYFKFHNLVGSEKPLLAEYPLGEANSYVFSETKRFNYFTVTDSHVHIFNLQCTGNGNKINANIKYKRKLTSIKKSFVYDHLMQDYVVEFGTDNFTLIYSSVESNEFALEIFTPDIEKKKTFTAIFENKEYEINNKDILIFKITNKDIQSMTINTTENIETIITGSPTSKMEQTSDEHSTVFIERDGNIYYNYYQIVHEFNTNYHVEVELENELNEKIPLCYYLATTAHLGSFGQNCFLIPGKGKGYIKLNNLFKYVEESEEAFNLKEPQYYLVIYENKNSELIPDYYRISNIVFTTDLSKSIPINNTYTSQYFLYLDAKLEKDKDSYYNIDFNTKTLENHIDLYILSDTSQYEELKFDIKCIIRYEYAIDFLKDDFTDENNVCFVMNDKDYKSNVFHIIFKNAKNMRTEYLIIKIRAKENMDVKFVVKEYELIDNTFSLNENVLLVNEQSVYKISEIEKSYLSQFTSKNIIFYDYDIDGIELYARRKNKFEQIFKGSFVILDPKMLLEKYNNYDKFLIAIGKHDCEDYCSVESKYQIKYIDNYMYITLEEFQDEYHLPINIKDCKKNLPYYILFDYGKQIENSLYVAKYTFIGSLSNNVFFDHFQVGNFEKSSTVFSNFHKLVLDKLHLHVIRFTCENNLFTYFDYFTKIDLTDTIINLQLGKMKYVVIPAGKNYTFNYESINRIRVELISRNNTDPIMVFENKIWAMETGHRKTFIRINNDINLLYLAAPVKDDIPLRITTLISVEDLPKTEIKDLYVIDDKFIYDVPEKVISIIFTIKRVSPNLRMLLTEDEEIEVCYNEADIVLLEKNGFNCFNLKDSYELTYTPADPNKNLYLVFYPKIDNKKFNVSQVFVTSENEGNDGENEKKDDKKKESGLKWYVILLIILVVLIVLVLVVLIILKKTKKTVTSNDIEKDNKQTERPSSLSVIN